MDKKKIKSFLCFFLVVLSIIYLSFSSLSYATEQNVYDYYIPLEWFDACINYYNSLSLPIDFNCSSGDLFDYYNNVVSGELINLWSGEGLTEMNMIVQLDYQTYSNGSSVSKLVFIQNNNTIGNVADNNCQLTLNEANPIKVKAIVPTFSLEVSKSADGNTIRYSYTIKTSSGQTSTKTYNDLIFSYNSQVNSNTTTLIGMPLFGVNPAPLNVVSCKINNVDNYWYFINNFYNINTQLQEDIPSGDSGENGGLGNITNNSGENNGNINLQPIQNSLDNINTNINDINNNMIKSGELDNIINNHTTRVVDSINNLNSYDDNVIESNLDDILEQEFDVSASIGSINENFLNGFEDETGDLILSWDGISYFDVPLIPSGEINFTELVESDESINRMYNYFQLFCQISFGFILICSYYDLALATLGLGAYFATNRKVEEDSIESLEDTSVDDNSMFVDYYVNKFKAERDIFYDKRKHEKR